MVSFYFFLLEHPSFQQCRIQVFQASLTNLSGSFRIFVTVLKVIKQDRNYKSNSAFLLQYITKLLLHLQNADPPIQASNAPHLAPYCKIPGKAKVLNLIS